jgi:hypothetical protein
MLPGPKDVTEPHKELRFTRGAQATLFALIAAVCCGASAVIIILNLIPKDPLTPWWWPLVPLPLAALCFRLAFRCARHAYIILTPLGIEIFPFFNSREHLQVLYWSEIADAEVNESNQLVIHFNEEQTAGVVASLAPLAPTRRTLLEQAIAGRMDFEWVEVSPPKDHSA